MWTPAWPAKTSESTDLLIFALTFLAAPLAVLSICFTFQATVDVRCYRVYFANYSSQCNVSPHQLADRQQVEGRRIISAISVQATPGHDHRNIMVTTG